MHHLLHTTSKTKTNRSYMYLTFITFHQLLQSRLTVSRTHCEGLDQIFSGGHPWSLHGKIKRFLSHNLQYTEYFISVHTTHYYFIKKLWVSVDREGGLVNQAGSDHPKQRKILKKKGYKLSLALLSIASTLSPPTHGVFNCSRGLWEHGTQQACGSLRPRERTICSQWKNKLSEWGKKQSTHHQHLLLKFSHF